jgi:hypothetical protein
LRPNRIKTNQMQENQIEDTLHQVEIKTRAQIKSNQTENKSEPPRTTRLSGDGHKSNMSGGVSLARCLRYGLDDVGEIKGHQGHGIKPPSGALREPPGHRVRAVVGCPAHAAVLCSA